MAIVEVRPTGVAAGGDGLAREASGRVVFVEGALPGELVRAEVVDARKDFAKARVAQIVEASPSRVEPPCPFVAAGCGGCQWQHVAVEAQPELKEAVVRDALRRQAHIDAPPVTRVEAVPAVAYRTTVRLALVGGRAAYHRRHAADLVPVDSCLIAHPRLEELIVDGRWGAAREVTLRVSATTGERLAVVTPRVSEVQVPEDVTVIGENQLQGGRRAALSESVAGRSWRVSAASFFQSGPAAAELLVDAVVRAAGDGVGEGSLVVDTYCGVGLLGGAVAAASGARVIGIEDHRPAVLDARHNLRDLDAQIVEAEVATWAPAPDLGRPAVVIADPARTGLGRRVVASLTALAAPVLVLVSCDPGSLGRDAALLLAAGYDLDDVQILDLFPHTFHVEVVTRWVRPAAPADL